MKLIKYEMWEWPIQEIPGSHGYAGRMERKLRTKIRTQMIDKDPLRNFRWRIIDLLKGHSRYIFIKNLNFLTYFNEWDSIVATQTFSSKIILS